MGVGKAKQNYFPNQALGYLEGLLGLNHPFPRETYFVKSTLKEFFWKINNQYVRNSFHFFGWIMFLLFWYLSYFIVIFYMATGTFSSTKGIKIALPDFQVTREEMELLKQGVPITDQKGLVLISAQKEKLLIVKIPNDSKKINLLFQNNQEVWGFCKKSSKFRDKFIVLEFSRDSEFQHLVDVLDNLHAKGLRENWCNSKIFFTSD